MSKSLGNVVDPVDTIAEYGTDALRYTLATGALAADVQDTAACCGRRCWESIQIKEQWARLVFFYCDEASRAWSFFDLKSLSASLAQSVIGLA